MKISVQLYSLKDAVAEEGLSAVLKAVKKSGFDAVELAGTYGKTPEALKAEIFGVGLRVSGAHIPLADMLDTPDGVADLAETLDFTQAIVPYLPPEDWNERFDALCEKLLAAQKNMTERGLTLGYHNHAHEFSGGDGLQKLAGRLPELKFEIDTFWVKVAGYEPKEYLEKFAKRLCAVHVKELSSLGKDAPNPLPGDGVTDFAAVLRVCATAKVPYAVLEMENLNMPYENYLRKSCAFMKNVLNG